MIFFQFFPQAGTVENNTWHIEVLLLFLSLRYGADLGFSRLVQQWDDQNHPKENYMTANLRKSKTKSSNVYLVAYNVK